MAMSTAAQAAKELVSRRKNNQQLGRLDSLIRPTTLDESLAIQTEVVKQMEDSVGGWKCLLPLAGGEFIVAPILADTVRRNKVCDIFSENKVARIEPEIAFVLGKDLPANKNGYSADVIDNAVSSCHMALELIKGRFASDSDADYFEKLSDCLVNQGLFIGPQIEKELAYQAAEVSINVTQHEVTKNYAGVHPNNSSYKPLHWLIDTMSKRGVSFSKGQAIITGSFAGIIELDLDAECEIEYEGLGDYKVTFKAV